MILRNPSSLRDSFFLTCWFLLSLFSVPLSAQGVVGLVKDNISNLPVEDALVNILHHDSILLSLTTDNNGAFFYAGDDAIRINFSIISLGYKPFISEEILLDGYSTFRMESHLEREAYALEEITVVSFASGVEPYLLRVTKEDLNTIAGNYDDPVRVAVSSPGIVQINDQANHISVRGQNPLLNSWYLEGLEIVNPNHTNNAGTFSDQPAQSGGGINMFSAQALGKTDIYTGINPLHIGRSAGAVIDMHLHESVKPEFRAKAGFLGFEFGGGKEIGNNGILDVNLRYSFTGLLADLGVDFGGEKIGFYDGVISYNHHGKKHSFKAFGWAGRSTNDFSRVENAADRERYKDFFDINYQNAILGAGLRYENTISSRMSFKGGIAYSTLDTEYSREGQFGAAPVTLHLQDKPRILSSVAEVLLRVSSTIVTSAGIDYTYRSFSKAAGFRTLFDKESFLRPFLHSTIELSRAFTLELGGEVHYAFTYFTDAASLYPGYRAHFQWKSGRHILYGGARHAAGQNIASFDEEVILAPLLVDKYEIGWITSGLKNSFSIKTYYQYLKNMTVFLAPEGYLHFTDVTDPVPFMMFPEGNNDGKGKYYGVEAQWKYRNNKGWRISANQTFYESLRSNGDDFFSTGHYDGHYGTNVTIAKEILRVKKGKNRIWNFSLRGMLQGGLREQFIDVDGSAAAENTVYAEPGIFQERLDPYKRIDGSISRTIAHRKIRWRYALDIQNLAGFTNIAYHYYDPFLQGIESQEQLGIIPVFSIQASW